jgi:hypothetical protein
LSLSHVVSIYQQLLREETDVNIVGLISSYEFSTDFDESGHVSSGFQKLLPTATPMSLFLTRKQPLK